MQKAQLCSWGGLGAGDGDGEIASDSLASAKGRMIAHSAKHELTTSAHDTASHEFKQPRMSEATNKVWYPQHWVMRAAVKIVFDRGNNAAMTAKSIE